MNSSGKGSLYYIAPTNDNPLFADHPYYSGAYFNVHLPHLDKEIIPHDYYEFMRSGFSNVFGLTRPS